jgi:hypothetical protein
MSRAHAGPATTIRAAVDTDAFARTNPFAPGAAGTALDRGLRGSGGTSEREPAPQRRGRRLKADAIIDTVAPAAGATRRPSIG